MEKLRVGTELSKIGMLGTCPIEISREGNLISLPKNYSNPIEVIDTNEADSGTPSGIYHRS